jgi:PAS domain S-box-containing protein
MKGANTFKRFLAVKFAVFIVIIFAVETSIMFMFARLNIEHTLIEPFLDSFILILVMTPTIYSLFISLMRKDELLRYSKEQYRALVQTANDAIISIDAAGVVIFWNAGAEKIFGYVEEEVVGRNIALIMPERALDLHRAGLERVAGGGEPRIIGRTVSMEGVRKGGEEFPIDLSLAMWEVEGKKYFTSIIRDVTDRKKAEEALRRSNEYFRGIIENSPEPMALSDEEQRIVFLNKKFTEIFGYRLADIPTVEEWWPLAYPDPSHREKMKTEWYRRVDAVVREGVEFAPMEGNVVCKNGRRRDIVFTFSFIGNRGLTMFHDVTERKAIENELIASQTMLAKAQKLAHLGNWEMDLQTGKGTWSDESYRIFGFEPGAFEPTCDKFKSLLHPEDRNVVNKILQKILVEGISSFEFDARIIMPDGKEGVVHDKLEVVTDKDGKPVKITGVNYDITERKLYERKLERANLELSKAMEQIRQAQDVMIRSEKLAAIGTLSAGVAHEILNPLNIISTSVQLMQMDELPAKMKEMLAGIMTQVRRATKIANNLRMFAHYRKSQKVALDVREFFNKTAALIEGDLQLDNIFIQRDFDSDTPIIYADEDNIAQVFLNLMSNARDAMRERREGAITVKTSKFGDGVEIRFSDNGPGIPANIIGKIFDPFFTTKEPGTGTGLGLSLLHTIIADHKGSVSVESEEGKGALFIIHLPMGSEGGGRSKRN